MGGVKEGWEDDALDWGREEVGEEDGEGVWGWWRAGRGREVFLWDFWRLAGGGRGGKRAYEVEGRRVPVGGLDEGESFKVGRMGTADLEACFRDL